MDRSKNKKTVKQSREIIITHCEINKEIFKKNYIFLSTFKTHSCYESSKLMFQ